MMKQETATIRFLYATAAGRCCLKLLVQPWISKAVGAFLSSGLSRPMVSGFIKKHHIDMSAYPQRKYRSFNDFFTRQRSRNEAGTVSGHLVSPCDAFLSAYPIDQNSTFHIKHVDYSLQQLLRDNALAKQYEGGTCLIFRLTPQHYHRYCYACTGSIRQTRKIGGKLHCVRPLAYTSRPVFVENSRASTLIHSDPFGHVLQMEVGALLVGKISNHPSTQAQQGVEKGYFEFGGSTIILLLEKDRVRIFPELLTSEEKDVRYGQIIGVGNCLSTTHGLKAMGL